MAPKAKSKAKSKSTPPSSILILKTPHNYTAILGETDLNTCYHSMIRVRRKSKLKYMLEVKAPIYQVAQSQFWANA